MTALDHPDGLRPIRPSRLYEQVADRLREFIDANDLKPGDRLIPERELAERMGVSRTSVRQALTVLRVLGMVDIRQGDGVYLLHAGQDVVARLTREVMRSELDQPMIFEVRAALETQAARLAANHGTEEDHARIEATLEAMAAALSAGSEAVPEDRQFHRAVMAASRNPLLIQLFDLIEDAIDRASEPSPRLAGRTPISLRKHAVIYEAIRARDESLAARRMRSVVASGRLRRADAET